MIKFLGAFLIVGACFAFSLQYIHRTRESITATEELSRLLTELAEAIAFRLEPLPDILTRLAEEEKPPAQLFVKQMALLMKDDHHRPLNEVWQTALHAFSAEKKLPEKADRLMHAVVERLGQADVESESKRLLLVADELHVLAKELEKSHAKTEKMVESLGFLLGISIVILLI